MLRGERLDGLLAYFEVVNIVGGIVLDITLLATKSEKGFEGGQFVIDGLW